MPKESFLVNSDNSLIAFIVKVKALSAQYPHLTWDFPRIGEDRSIDQNALLHVWIGEVVAYRLEIDRKKITKGQLEGTKLDLKGLYYQATGERFMVHKIEGVVSGRSKVGYTSSKTWKVGEMFQVLTWMQMWAAEFGLVLESKGKFAKLKREQNG